MAGAKVKVGYEVHPDAHEMLKTIVERYKLPDESKALRCLSWEAFLVLLVP